MSRSRQPLACPYLVLSCPTLPKYITPQNLLHDIHRNSSLIEPPSLVSLCIIKASYLSPYQTTADPVKKSYDSQLQIKVLDDVRSLTMNLYDGKFLIRKLPDSQLLIKILCYTRFLIKKLCDFPFFISCSFLTHRSASKHKPVFMSTSTASHLLPGGSNIYYRRVLRPGTSISVTIKP